MIEWIRESWLVARIMDFFAECLFRILNWLMPLDGE